MNYDAMNKESGLITPPPLSVCLLPFDVQDASGNLDTAVALKEAYSVHRVLVSADCSFSLGGLIQEEEAACLETDIRAMMESGVVDGCVFGVNNPCE